MQISVKKIGLKKFEKKYKLEKSGGKISIKKMEQNSKKIYLMKKNVVKNTRKFDEKKMAHQIRKKIRKKIMQEI